jgi:hypothetical protein
MKPGWEQGFLEKASRKISSQDTTIAGRAAYRVTAELDGADGTYELIGTLVVARDRNFNVGITKRGGNALQDADVRQFLESFRIVGNSP